MKKEQQKRLDELMKKSLEGDNSAYKELLTECSKIAKNFIKKRISKESEVEDIVQEILLSVHKSKHTYNPERPFLPWFYAIANYRLQDFLRSLYSNKEMNLDEVSEAFVFKEEDKSNEVEKNQMIETALKTLNQKQQSIVKLLYLEGYSVAETANSLDISISDVKVSAHRALKKIGKKFNK